ncbi:hypothetical protein SCHPADRAFT_888533 [Schizopora paradoxa]|uniref:Uncharacterized protein n=1 Tax=Schizopora paradoxa TaxID=27342 RepID=A0A0H2SEA8_9AGAM|nr:hypothetical protein SCHPADRAFT_888533 [Schizopora paradoxa]
MVCSCPIIAMQCKELEDDVLRCGLRWIDSPVRAEFQRWGTLGGTQYADSPGRMHHSMRFGRIPLALPEELKNNIAPCWGLIDTSDGNSDNGALTKDMPDSPQEPRVVVGKAGCLVPPPLEKESLIWVIASVFLNTRGQIHLPISERIVVQASTNVGLRKPTHSYGKRGRKILSSKASRNSFTLSSPSRTSDRRTVIVLGLGRASREKVNGSEPIRKGAASLSANWVK